MHALLWLMMLVQTPDDEPRARTIVNFRLEEYFDEVRADGVTDAAHPYTLSIPYPNGQLSFNTRCHWLRRDERRPLLQDPEDEPASVPQMEPVLDPPVFKAGSLGGKLQFATSLGCPTLDALSSIDGRAVAFDDVDVDALPGPYLSATLAIGGVELLLFADYLGGSFTNSTSTETVTQDVQWVQPGHHGDPPIQIVQEFHVVDEWELTGDIWLLEVGIAPVLASIATGDGAWRADIALAMGIYVGGLTGMEVARSGSVSESVEVPDETLFGAFVGPTVHGAVRIARGVGMGLFGEGWRLVGDTSGWTNLVGLELKLDF